MNLALLKKIVLPAVALLIAWIGLCPAIASADSAPSPGYLIDSQGSYVRNNYGQCWRTGYWTPAMAVAECDPELVKKEGPKKAEPAPKKPAPPEYEKVTFQAEALFDFDKYELRPDGQTKLDELADKLNGYTNIDIISVTGHADRIGTEAYNQKLSERRANTVRDYLIRKGLDGDKIKAFGKGESEPNPEADTSRQCRRMPAGELIACLQPDRRVEVEIMTTRQKK